MTTEHTDNEDRLESTLGELLHRTREAKRKTIEEAAETTRIHASFLRALEEDDFEKLPAEVFARGFIRLYASYLGLDPDDTFRRYAAQDKTEFKEPTIKQYHSEVIDEEIMDRTSIFIKKKKSKILPVTILLIILILFYMFGVFLKTEDRNPGLPAGADIAIPQVNNLPGESPEEGAEPEEQPSEAPPEPTSRLKEPTNEASPEKSPQYTKRKAIAAKPPAPADKPVPDDETATKSTADLSAAARPEVPAPDETMLPVTVNVATANTPTTGQTAAKAQDFTPLSIPDSGALAATVNIPADTP
jgi:cytoskeleton protein RodZ